VSASEINHLSHNQPLAHDSGVFATCLALFDPLLL
jgi:hypothetical protein